MDRSQILDARDRDKEQGQAPAGAGSSTLVDELLGQLAAEITSGTLPPGARLDEMALAKRFAVSRTPVRETLRQLEAAGLVERRPYRGTIVATLSAARLHEMFTAMGEVEAVCARQAALMMSQGERSALRNLHDRMAGIVRSGDTEGYAKSNTDFHRVIYDGAHNGLLTEMVTGLHRRLAPFRRVQFRSVDRLAYSHAEHEAVTKAIERGAADEAARLMRQHMSLVGASFDALAHQMQPHDDMDGQ